jgi:hypothetical protein
MKAFVLVDEDTNTYLPQAFEHLDDALAHADLLALANVFVKIKEFSHPQWTFTEFEHWIKRQ